MTDFIQVVTTTGKQSEAAGIAELLIDRRLAACVQVAGPITSTYRWEGKIERAQKACIEQGSSLAMSCPPTSGLPQPLVDHPLAKRVRDISISNLQAGLAGLAAPP